MTWLNPFCTTCPLQISYKETSYRSPAGQRNDVSDTNSEIWSILHSIFGSQLSVQIWLVEVVITKGICFSLAKQMCNHDHLLRSSMDQIIIATGSNSDSHREIKIYCGFMRAIFQWDFFINASCIMLDKHGACSAVLISVSHLIKKKGSC